MTLDILIVRRDMPGFFNSNIHNLCHQARFPQNASNRQLTKKMIAQRYGAYQMKETIIMIAISCGIKLQKFMNKTCINMGFRKRS